MQTLVTHQGFALETELEDTIKDATSALLRRQRDDGHWIFELEADATIPAEYIMLEHYLDDVDDRLEAKICRYLLRIQNPDGGWPLFYRGESDISASVKAYFALKLAGHDPESGELVRARRCILALGGAARCNVFTRFALALFGQVPWRAVPVMPVEIMHLPRWFFFHLDKISYWSRTVVVPLLVLAALRPRARNPRAVSLRELFVTAPDLERHYMHPASATPVGRAFFVLDEVLRAAEPLIPQTVRARAIAKAMKFFLPRLNGTDGLGAIFPAMANAVMALDAMGYANDDPLLVQARAAIRALVVETPEEAYCQPCVSPVWDTALTVQALLETEDPATAGPVARANAWLVERQVTEFAGDYAVQNRSLRPGGWAFQYRNDYYPDVDDTAVVAMGLHREDAQRHAAALARAHEWVVGMQSADGGWGAFDIGNTHYALNHIPFADHGALLDPPTEDVTARCLGMLLQMGDAPQSPVACAGLDYLRRTQQPDGSWYGRWGSNYVYGTWSVLNAFCAAGETSANSATVRRAVGYLARAQQPDGGWGEDLATYYEERRGYAQESTASQTAWALLALMAAGETAHPAVARGVRWLIEQRNGGGLWDEPWYTGVGFPRVFYLRYHGYCAFFPLLALARYRNVALRGAALGAYGF